MRRLRGHDDQWISPERSLGWSRWQEWTRGLALGVHYRWYNYYPCSLVWLHFLPRYTLQHQSLLLECRRQSEVCGAASRRWPSGNHKLQLEPIHPSAQFLAALCADHSVDVSLPQAITIWVVRLTVNRFWNTTVGKVSNTVMQLYLKYNTQHKWSIYQVNNMPTAINGFNIIMVLLLNIYIDTTGYRMRAVAVNLAILLFGTICLVVWNVPLGLKIVAYMFAGLDGPLSPIYYSWANILTSGDTQVRALTLAIMNSFGAALTTVIQQFLYPVTDAPQFSKGFKASLGFLCGMCIWVVVVRVFEMNELRRKGEGELEVMEAADEEDRSNSGKGGQGSTTTPYSVKADHEA